MARARKYYVVDQVHDGLWEQVGHFTSKSAAERLRSQLDGKTRVKRTYPSATDRAPRRSGGSGGSVVTYKDIQTVKKLGGLGY